MVTTISSAGQPDQEATIYRRYKEFEKLNRLLRSAFTGSHLLDSLPSLPGTCACPTSQVSLIMLRHWTIEGLCLTGKVYNPFANQMDEAFIENRRLELEVYLNKLIHMSKASKNSDLLRFLGLDPITGLPLDPMDSERCDARKLRSPRRNLDGRGLITRVRICTVAGTLNASSEERGVQVFVAASRNLRGLRLCCTCVHVRVPGSLEGLRRGFMEELRRSKYLRASHMCSCVAEGHVRHNSPK
jgi:hypothetical protein